MRSARARLLLLLLLLPVVATLAPEFARADAVSFADGFEAGNLSAWTTTNRASAQQRYVFAGSWGLSLKSGGSPSWVRKTVSARSEAYVRFGFNVRSRSTAASLLELRSASNARILGIGLSGDGSLTRAVGTSGKVKTSSVGPSAGWHELQVHALVQGSSSRVDVWLDGVPVAGLGGTPSLGSSSIAIVQLGEAAKGRTFNIAFDEAAVDGSILPPIDTTSPSDPQNLHTNSISSGAVELDWAASTDDAAVTGYRVYRDGASLDTTSSTSFIDDAVSQGSTYAYEVAAFDAAGNRSGKAGPLSVDVPGSSGEAPEIMAAGDIACDPTDSLFNGGNGTARHCRAKAVSDLLVNGDPDAVLALGDTQYVCGGFQAFNQSFDPSWGRVFSKLYPTPGNHEYMTSGGTDCDANAAGYFQYFGARAPGEYYSFDIGDWHIISLNSECSFIGGCGVGSDQEEWLAGDLEANPASCTIAYWHEPRYGTKPENDRNAVDPLWDALVAADVEVVLAGHLHDYYRMQPLDASGDPDPQGIRQFIVGTGGEEVWPVDTSRSFIQEAGQAFGALKLTLHSDSYDWEFVPADGDTYTDSGSDTCH